MRARQLPQSEWPRVAHTEIGPALSVLPPDDTRIVVVENGSDEILGAWALIRYVHVEGVWVHPDHRKRGRVAAHLLAGMRDVAYAWGHSVVLTAALTDDVRQLIAHLGGQPLPGDHYVVPLTGVRCRS